MYENGYVPPILTVDNVIFQIIDGHLSVLLIKRSQEPFKGIYALPGGYCAAGETTRAAMGRILETKAGIDVTKLKLTEQLYSFDTVARDPRGHAVSITYMGLGKDLMIHDSETVQSPEFFRLSDLPKLAYDHKAIIKYAHERLQSKLSYTNAVFALLDQFFTLTQLQTVYEAILCRRLDKRNFRKKFLTLDLVHDTNERLQDGAHRPARLFRFNKQALESLSRNFD